MEGDIATAGGDPQPLAVRRDASARITERRGQRAKGQEVREKARRPGLRLTVQEDHSRSPVQRRSGIGCRCCTTVSRQEAEQAPAPAQEGHHRMKRSIDVIPRSISFQSGKTIWIKVPDWCYPLHTASFAIHPRRRPPCHLSHPHTAPVHSAAQYGCHP